MIPGVRLFLDVEDLDNAGGIGALEQIVGRCGGLIVFLSDGYFASKNCQRELTAAVDQALPLVLVRERDKDHGGLDADLLRKQCPVEIKDRIFSRPLIEWHRIGEFQVVSLRQIGQALIKPLIPERCDDELYIESELVEMPMVLTSRLSTSPWNPGAEELSQEVISQASHIGEGPSCFLLLLNGRTYDNRTNIVDSVLTVLDAGQRLILVHDAEDVSFNDIIENTPQELLDRGLYKELAVPLFSHDHRKVSLRQIAAKMTTCVDKPFFCGRLLRRFATLRHFAMHRAKTRPLADSIRERLTELSVKSARSSDSVVP
mmetsp:Transcript_10259/g.27318  ORF Transcript_10259/g.27318 Transcript_10259/m.27318 type:complete len:316 (+) Transcript_10259:108-1055(+)